MAEISPRSPDSVADEKKQASRFISGKFFTPGVSMSGQMTCCCGYELFKHDELTWKCSGGNHIYRFQAGDVMTDKYGNIMFRIPDTQKNKK